MSFIKDFLKFSPAPSPPPKARAHFPSQLDIRKITYTSEPVALPADFLQTPLPTPIALEVLDFGTSPLPEYASCYAVVLDGVLSAAECATLLQLAEQSTGQADTDAWRPAMLNAGAGYEVLAADIRNSDRIVWDSQEVVDRLWARCCAVPGLLEELGVLQERENVLGKVAVAKGLRYRFKRVNERMRFLKYGAGQYFKAHCDGAYYTPDGSEQSFFTLHLYLNDSVAHGGDVEGGATTFFSRDAKRRLDVVPKMGRVLIFQHAKLYHSGEEVSKGIKYTMRTDLMYEMME